MKTRQLAIAIAIAGAMSGSPASADPHDYYRMIAQPTKAPQGSPNGTVVTFGSAASAEHFDYYKMIAHRAAASTKSRDQVKAELAAAAMSGELTTLQWVGRGYSRHNLPVAVRSNARR